MIRRLMTVLSRPLRAVPSSAPLATDTDGPRRRAVPRGDALLASSLLRR